MADSPDRRRRLESLVQAALERPADERAAYLAEGCGDDEDLRREAASLIDRDARAEAFLATPLDALAADAMTYSPGGTPQAGEPVMSPGSRIGAYEIRERLGAGGMGEVYRARDHALHRDVAIKVLPAAFLADRKRLARFEREARLLASLNHPHVGAVYGLEGSGARRAIVLELIDGETLEARLRRGPLPAAQALRLAVQIADALDHAHRRGVTHRDLKPGNIMLTRSGVKLLDFGLAKWSLRPPGYVPSSDAGQPVRPEGVSTLTAKGTILGTLQYMAPEQLEGKPVDARVDVFAFGAVLYEMLTGRKAFDGGSAPAIMAAVLNTEPESLDTLHRQVSPSLVRVVRKCLAKDPDARWQTTRDLTDALQWIVEESAPTAAAPGARSNDAPSVAPAEGAVLARRWRFAVALLGAAVLAGWAGWALARSGDPPAPPAVTRFTMQPPSGGLPTISPNASEILYSRSAGPGQPSLLFVRRLDQFDDAPVAGTERASAPFYSPDGQWVAFFSGQRLLKVHVRAGTAPVVLCECAGGLGNVWLTDGTIIFATFNSPLMRVSADGGEPAAITSLLTSPRESDHHNPAPVPGGKALLFTAHAASGRFDVVAQTLATGERKVLVESAYDAHVLPTGHLVFARNGRIHAAPFDAARLALTGPVVTLVDRVDDDPSSGWGGYQVSASGSLVFRPEPSREGRTLTWVSRTGQETPIPLAPREFSTPRVSPDGTHLAFTAAAQDGRRDIYTYELSSEKIERLTKDGDNRAPLWTRDGQRLSYASTRDGATGVWWRPADGSSVPEALVSSREYVAPGSWSADGRTLVYTDGDSGPADSRTMAVTVDGDRQPRSLFPESVTRMPRVSPDGRWLALTGIAELVEIHVASFPSLGPLRQVSVGGGRQPLWSRDGRELVYRFGGRVFSVSVDTSRGLRFSAPTVLFEGSYVRGDVDVHGLDYDLAPDGRFLMIKPSPDELAPPSVRVVMNWIEEVKQRVPTGR
ncbi:MAG: protein kinase domain-containing protein [Acidobacteriota bacterium]